MQDFIVNGESIHDIYSKQIVVTKSAGFQLPDTKDKLIENIYVSGANKLQTNAIKTIDKKFNFCFLNASLQELRRVKNFFNTAKKITFDEEPDVFYEVILVNISDSDKETYDAYNLTVTFTCQPFAYQINQPTLTLTANNTLTNATYNDMYPRIAIYGTSASQTSLKIGSETMYFKALDTKLTVECKPGEQNVLDKYNAEANNVKRGDFFHVKPGNNTVTLGAGITKVEILCRWWW